LMAVFIAPGVVSQLCGLLGISGSYQIIAGESIHMPNALGWILNLATFGVAIWALVTLGFLKGTSGANRSGPDPLMREARAVVPGGAGTGTAVPVPATPCTRRDAPRRTAAGRAGPHRQLSEAKL